MSNQPNMNKTLQAQIIAQWITSLAISVICCAILFIVFAQYIVDLNSSNNLMTVKIEVMHEQISQLKNEITNIKRMPAPQQAATAPAAPQPTDATQAPAPTDLGVQVNEPGGVDTEKDGIMLQTPSGVMTPDVAIQPPPVKTDVPALNKAPAPPKPAKP